MKTTNNPTEFTSALLKSTKVKFEGDELKVECNRINQNNSKRAVQLRYFHKIRGMWQSFATFVSPSNLD